MSVIYGPSSVTFHTDFNETDPSYVSFTWNGDEPFFLPPSDQMSQMHLDFDWGGHGEVNRTAQFYWREPVSSGYVSFGHERDYIVTLTFAPNGRWLEDFTPADFDPDGNFFKHGNRLPSWEVAFEGGKHLHHWGPHASYLPQDEILAEGAWAPSHHATHHDWLLG